jgi:hypothetical protein
MLCPGVLPNACVPCECVQNPPGLPTLAIVYVYLRIFGNAGSCLLIDWHNYSHSVLRASLEYNPRTGEHYRDAGGHA